jgi:hypothetical protein
MAFTRPRASQINFDVTNISDPLLRINSNETGSADKDSGIVIERGNDQNVAIIYDESANQFTLVNTDEIGTTSGNVTIASYAGLQLGALKPSGLTINSAYAFPTSDGSANQVLQTNGSGTLSFASISSTINLAGDSGTDAYSTGATLTFDGGTGINTTVTNDQVSIAVSNAVALIASSLQLAGGTMSGAIAMGTNRITGVGDPVGSQDAVTKAYFDANTSSFSSNASGFSNSTFITVPGAVNFDLVKQQDQSGDAETPFVASGSLDAFGVSLSEVYDMMEPIGKSTTTDLGALS